MTTLALNLYGIDDPEFATQATMWLVDGAIKTCALLVVTGSVAWLLRRRSAATVHRVWTLGFCGCLLIPAASLFAPLGTLPVIPNLLADRAEAARPFVTATMPLSAATLPVAGIDDPAVAARKGATSHQPSAAVAVFTDPPTKVMTQPLTSAGAVSNPPRWLSATALCLVWLAGVAVCAVRSVRLHWLLRRVLRRCESIESELWKSHVRAASQALGLSRDVRLLRCAELRTPAVTGLLRPIVLVPDDAESWTPERRRLVLLHELGHAQRRDLLTHAVARLVCALHWFNPLCWLGLHQMGKLRELACDDLVLTSGQQAGDYADVLLDVARTYRHRELGMAVGMARRANVEDRILAILDRARDRVLLSPRAARRWAVGMLGLVLLLGCLRTNPAPPSGNSSTSSGQTGTQAVEAAGAQSPTSDKGGVAQDDVRTMQVRITDDVGQPLEKASLHVSVWELDGKRNEHRANRDFITNVDGIADVELPRRLRILRMWPTKHGYVPEFVNFDEGSHDEGLRIPDKYEFKLARGTELSGTVVDERGEPISGVKVEVMVDVRDPASGDSAISMWLTDIDFNCDVPVTDTDGRWSIQNAPRPADGEPYVFWLKHTHPNYVKDAEWGELQKKQGVTSAMLRDGTAKVVLPRGVTVTGTVVDPVGKPVSQGLVIWHDDPYLAQGVNETAISNEGRFETLPLSPGECPITIIAPGFKPVRQIVAVEQGMDELRLAVEPGNRLVMKIVDGRGNPIANAYVGIEQWGKSKAIYNHKHPNVPESGIPRNADENGVYVWDWAPSNAVTYWVSSKGSTLRDLTLVANGNEHVVQLSQELMAWGRVTDAQTGQPVKSFRAIPVTEFRPQFLSTSHEDAIPGKEGGYQLRLTDAPEPSNRYRVRLEAAGYRSLLSERSLGPDDGRVEMNFTLERAAGLVGRVVDRDGKAVAGASIVQGTPSDVPMMQDGALDWGTELKSGSDGTFELLATFEPVRLRAVHESGFAEVLRQPDEEIGTLELQPWARVSGRLVQDGQPVAEQWVTFAPLPSRGLGEARFQDAYSAQTDADGRFAFERLPPGFGSIRTQLGPWRDSPLTSSEAVPLMLAPGEQRELVLGGRGVTLTGRVNATGRGDASLNQNWSLNYLIRRDSELPLPADYPTLDVDPSAPVEGSWYLKPQFHSWLAARPNYFVKPSPDGDLRIHGVAPGRYDLVLRLYEQPAGCLVETIGEQVVSIEVTEADVAAGTKDLGTIDVACRVGPRIGENMQAYKIVDATGRERTIQELHGGYVVLHVWASWCAPCLGHMPEIQNAVTEWNGRSITVVGLNIDEDRSQAQSLVQQNGWNWAQMYLGDESDMPRQLAISTVPTYYLIGPDGNLAASSNEWSAIREALTAAAGEAK